MVAVNSATQESLAEKICDKVESTYKFKDLRDILDEVYGQAAFGKGQQRHGNGKGWTDQPWVQITDGAGIGFLLGQAMKKTTESRGMGTEAACKELLGAMHYLAMAVHYRRTNDGHADC